MIIPRVYKPTKSAILQNCREVALDLSRLASSARSRPEAALRRDRVAKPVLTTASRSRSSRGICAQMQTRQCQCHIVQGQQVQGQAVPHRARSARSGSARSVSAGSGQYGCGIQHTTLLFYNDIVIVILYNNNIRQ